MTAFPTFQTDGLFGRRPLTSHDGPSWEALRHQLSSWSQRFAVRASCSGHGCLLRCHVNQRERSGHEALQVNQFDRAPHTTWVADDYLIELQFASTPLHCAIWVADDSLRCHAPEVRWSAWRLTMNILLLTAGIATRPLGMLLRNLRSRMKQMRTMHIK